MQRFISVILGTVILMLGSSLSAATLSGTIKNAQGDGIANMQVRLWAPGAKGFVISQTTTTPVGGSFTFSNISAGEYMLDTRPAMNGPDYADTWYDVAPPVSGGLIIADADRIEVADGDNLTGYDITVQASGMLRANVGAQNIARLANIRVRVESTTDHRYHHNDTTKALPADWAFVARGLVTNHQYRVIYYDPTSVYGLVTVNGPLTPGMVVPATVLPAGPVPDDNEPNDSAGTATEISALPFQMDASLHSNPRFVGGQVVHGEVDWYCRDVAEGDRLLARVHSEIEIDGVMRPHPWFDSILGFYNSTGTQQILYNDDDPAGGTLGSFIDTGLLSAGRYCFVVSAFGDADFSGTLAQSSGPYRFAVEMGNRRPQIEVDFDGQPLSDGQTIQMDEGDTLSFDLVWSDPDNDNVMVTITHEDNQSSAVGGTSTLGPDNGTYVYTASQTAAGGSPHTITITITDGEFTETIVVTVVIGEVNVPPTLPVLLTPIGGELVTENPPSLTLQNSTDEDLDALVYEFELRENDPAGAPDQTSTENEDPTGTTTWIPGLLTENAFVFWRARAFDGDPMGYSPWTGWESFRVDSVNDPPERPVVLKPTEGEIVMTATPRVSVRIPDDPEDDDVQIFIELSSDSTFETVLQSSPGIAGETHISTTVEWSPTPLAQGQYYVRARAEDERGARSDWSDIVGFQFRRESNLGPPGFGEGLNMLCNSSDPVDSFPQSLTLENVSDDPEVRFEVFISRSEASEVAVFEVTVNQAAGSTTVVMVSGVILPGNYLIKVRAHYPDRTTDWKECQIRLVGDDDVEIPEPNDPNLVSNEAGCGCASAPGSGDSLLLLLLGVVGLIRRRVLRSR